MACKKSERMKRSFVNSVNILSINKFNRLENVKLSPSITKFYRYDFKKNVDRVIVQVDSRDTVCMTVAIQPPWVNTDI